MRTLGYSLFFYYLLLPISGFSQDNVDFKVTTVAELFGVPWGMTFISDAELMVSERDGTLSIINIKTTEITPLSGLPEDIHFQGQGGLLDVATPPHFEKTAWIYFQVDGQSVKISNLIENYACRAMKTIVPSPSHRLQESRSMGYHGKNG